MTGRADAVRAYVIVNRRARRLRRSGPLLSELCRTRPGVEVIETGSREELSAAARQLVRASPDAAVVLAGGDGSYMAGVSAIANAWGDRPLPRIALAPGGTVGTVARNWGMNGDLVRFSARLLDAIANGSAVETLRPTLRVSAEEERVGFIFGAGLVARFFERYEALGATGNLAAAWITLRVFTGSFLNTSFARSVLDPISCAVVLDGRPAPFDRVSLLVASVVRDLGLKMRLTYRAPAAPAAPAAGEAHGRFHVVATPLGPRALGPQMLLVLAARPLVGRPRLDELGRELELRFERGTGAYVLDGDLFRADTITVTPGPVLRLLSAR